MKTLTIYSTRTCSDCIRAKHWLEEHAIPFTNVFLEDDEKSVDEVLTITQGNTKTPVLVFSDGSILIEPTNEELTKKFTNA